MDFEQKKRWLMRLIFDIIDDRRREKDFENNEFDL